MCGIMGYIGEKPVQNILIQGLGHLEYRGYDSAGIAILDTTTKTIKVQKMLGRVEKLKQTMKPVAGIMGMGHTRWATHGRPSDVNAHPHSDCKGDLALIHNGIIENYLDLKQDLLSKGHHFASETDTEVIAHLIEEELKQQALKQQKTDLKTDLKKAVDTTLKKLIGTYALCVLHKNFDYIVVARNGSPLVLGLGKGENFFGSDVTAFIAYTKNAVYLNDFETAVVKKDSIQIFDKSGKPVKRNSTTINWDVEQAKKGGYEHFMLKEIFEQPRVVRDTLQVKISDDVVKLCKSAKKLFVIACGTASYAGLVGKYLIEQTAKIPVEWDAASEFRYKNPLIGRQDVLLVISQSGETADTLAALRLAKEKGAKVIGIINVVDSTIARESDQVIYTRAGPEIGVASTKAFSAQLAVLYRLAEKLSSTGKNLKLDSLPALIEKVLKQNDAIAALAKKYFMVYNFFFIGRNVMYPIALEGALKLKEISYIHAEAYAAGELKHGPIALVTDQVPTVALVPKNALYSKMISNIQEIKARNGKIIAIATEGDQEIKEHCTDVISLPKTDEVLYPFLATIAVQLLAYHIANLRECDIDKPRNLAKSVTVE
ncbi:TPA: glutamine--fructose-6-phosphate transaminase (isomerizing) [Candidatus Woesearchaeota archaeon]|nr:MAG: glucosamine-fructose-6-phosphate aminotransferase isomerizing [archaeon GW2011_AR16]HIG96095.1 glutamine--fructose-6-phosphate transaminase (isomerizing) [Candidatus Woesearchaeota archaeon]HII88174.1 glutamine--fructose-6-phosphate transaminase (isomerizing) [Candidatus Woesearchaeota archaeon]